MIDVVALKAQVAPYVPVVASYLAGLATHRYAPQVVRGIIKSKLVRAVIMADPEEARKIADMIHDDIDEVAEEVETEKTTAIEKPKA